MLHSKISKALMVIIGVLYITSCEENKKVVLNFPDTDLTQESMIPMPLQIKATNSAFALDQFTGIYTSESSDDLIAVGAFLADKIKSKTSLRLAVNETNTETVDRVIFIHQSEDAAFKSKEGYHLSIGKDTVMINAKTAEGAFRAVQTIRQLVPDVSNDTITDHKMWLIPTGDIKDDPNFEYRGAMLDVARHFFSVEDVKRYIDLLAYYKINVLHLHLTDDQGWRIEIKSWPKLTEIGGSTEVGGESGGFYTQEEYTDIVNYAAERYMMIIPEIDMPGHTNAASVSYPILNGNGKTPKLYEGMRVGFSTFDARKDTVYTFIDDVVREIAALTPGPYFHIGGDESHVTKKKDYVHFVNKVEKIVEKHGKRMIGWDEIANTDVSANSISQYWSSKENAQAAVKKKMKVILSPAKRAYLDMQYDSLSKHGLHWAAYIPVDAGYQWTPEGFDDIPLDQILGIEAPLWSETISDIHELEYLAFPRVIGYAELGWSTEENRDWENYKVRLANQAPFLDRMEVNYYPSKLIDWKKNKYTYEPIRKD
ncbi:family 20 glycosylhydrolase [Spongiimicrobium salis]|uniref:family 20 glycosylhydrolase n=1 Tax=Spongiimicrobium salis TaxID=1667022 RepID=UPI00374DF060